MTSQQIRARRNACASMPKNMERMDKGALLWGESPLWRTGCQAIAGVVLCNAYFAAPRCPQCSWWIPWIVSENCIQGKRERYGGVRIKKLQKTCRLASGDDEHGHPPFSREWLDQSILGVFLLPVMRAACLRWQSPEHPVYAESTHVRQQPRKRGFAQRVGLNSTA